MVSLIDTQEYTLHCVKTGYDKYDITVSFQSDVVVVQGTGCAHDKPCNGIELHFKIKHMTTEPTSLGMERL